MMRRRGSIRQQAAQQARQRPQQRQEHHRGDDVEQRVEIRHGAGIVRLERHHEAADRLHRDEHDADTDQPGEKIAERHALGRRAIAGGTLDHVGLQPGPVVDVDHGNLLELHQVGRRHQVGVDRVDPT